MAASSSRLSRQGRSFDVFLSFRGPDVRNTFLGHLHDALLRDGIRAFVDCQDLEKGEEITPSLAKAIKDSRIGIVLFSVNYASSAWCLSELEKIMERKKVGELVVKPVFFRLDPCEVRTPRNGFAEALAAHEDKLGRGSDKVKRWREALFEAGNLSGWHLDAHGNEAELVRSIVKDVNVLLDCGALDVAKYPVGIESRVEQVKALLDLESDEVLMLGLWGMGGVGKTTLAKAVFNAIAHQFDGCAFLPNVRENSTNPSVDLARLQEKLLSELLRQNEMTASSSAGGISSIKLRLCLKKVLVLLDDVNKDEQLDALAGELNWFGKGSRIIVTTRDSSLLIASDECIVHKVEALPYFEALKLFNRHAFPKKNSRQNIPMELVDSCLGYSSGLPLALVVLGSLLRNQPEHHWRSTLMMLEESPCEDIDKVLRVSFDELDHNAREVFLDIACFFKGKNRIYIENALDACGFQTSLAIQVLFERSLITTDVNDEIEMHDLLELMGKTIVIEKHPDEPGRRSRLWVNEDALDVFANGMGTDAITGIVLEPYYIEEVHFNEDALAKLKRLRLLIMRNVNYYGDPICFSSGLCWIEWSGYCASSFEFSRGRGSQHMRNLKCIILSGSGCLSKIPDLSMCPNLENLDLKGCKSLVEVDDSVGYLEKLIDLCLEGCLNLTKLPGKLHCTSLKTFNLCSCDKLERLPDCRNLEKLVLSGCSSLVEVNDSVGYLDKLVDLSLAGCSNIRKLPAKQNWKSLTTFFLEGCSKMDKFPEVMNRMESMEKLVLRGSGISELPASINNLISVRKLDFADCQNLVTIPSVIYKLRNLVSLDLRGCTRLEKFPSHSEDSTCLDGIVGFPSLCYLNLSECNLSEVEFLGDFNCFPELKTLFLWKNINITEIPSLARLQNLEKLCIHECRQLREIPELPVRLRVLMANECRSLGRIQGLSPRCIANFDRINLSSCPGLANQGIHLAGVLPLEEARNIRPGADFVFTGSELPDWLEEGHFPDTVSFSVPSKLSGNLVGILACGVFCPQYDIKDREIWLAVQIFVNGQYMTGCGYSFFTSQQELDMVWLRMLSWNHKCNLLQEDELLGKHHSDNFRVSVRFRTFRGGVIEKCGFRLIFNEEFTSQSDAGKRDEHGEETDECQEKDSNGVVKRMAAMRKRMNAWRKLPVVRFRRRG